MRNLTALRSEFEQAAQRLRHAVISDSQTDDLVRLAGEYALAASRYSKELKQILNAGID